VNLNSYFHLSVLFPPPVLRTVTIHIITLILQIKIITGYLGMWMTTI
jgi:hypothetical protein